MFRMEQNFVVFANGKIVVPFDLNADFNHTSGDCGNLGTVGQDDPAPSRLTILVLPNQNPLPQRFNIIAQGFLSEMLHSSGV